MDSKAVCRLCSKPISEGTPGVEFAGEAVHLKCASLETRLRSLFLREQSDAATETATALMRRAKQVMVPPNSSILVGRLEGVTVPEGRFMVGGIPFAVANGVSLTGFRPGVVVRVLYEPGPGTCRALDIRRVGVTP